MASSDESAVGSDVESDVQPDVSLLKDAKAKANHVLRSVRFFITVDTAYIFSRIVKLLVLSATAV